MPRISKVIPSLFNGVSQQPAALRNPSQCEISENAYPNIAEGLRKRACSEHIAKLRNAAATDAAVFVMDLGDNGVYVVVLFDGDIEIYDIAGQECTITEPDGVGYLDCVTPRKDLGMTVVGDDARIFNRTKVTAMLPDRSGNAITPQSVTSITRTDQTALMTTGAAHGITVGDWINVVGANQPEYNGWHEVLTIPLSTTLTYTVTGSPATPATGTITYTAVNGQVTSTVQNFAALPGATGTNNIHKIDGDPTNRFDDYYVKDTASGVWSEWISPAIQYKVDPATMPHKLVRTGALAFTFQKSTWDDRAVGDDTSAKIPSVIGRKLSDVFVHRARLGMIANEFLLLSRSASFTNLFVETATQVLDTDPIDTTSAHIRASSLKHAVPFNTALILFSDRSQFQFSGGDILSPRSARLDPITEFDSDTQCRPVAAGQELFFPVPRGEFVAMRNYYIDTNALTNNAADITAHVPAYIPKDVFKLAVSTSEDVVFALTLQERNAVYVYKYYWTEEKKVQSAWQKFNFSAGDVILGAEFFKSVCYLVVQRADGVYLDKMDLQPNRTDTGLNYFAHLDRRVSLTGTFSAADNWTTWTLPYDDAGTMNVVLGASFTGQVGDVRVPTRPSNTTVRLTGDFSGGPCFIGRTYNLRYRLSEIFFKDENGLPVLGGQLKLMNMLINFFKSGFFKVLVTPYGRGQRVATFTGAILGDIDVVVGTIPITSGSFHVDIGADARRVVIELQNATPLPSTFQLAEWTAEYVTETSRQK